MSNPSLFPTEEKQTTYRTPDGLRFTPQPNQVSRQAANSSAERIRQHTLQRHQELVLTALSFMDMTESELAKWTGIAPQDISRILKLMIPIKVRVKLRAERMGTGKAKNVPVRRNGEDVLRRVI